METIDDFKSDFKNLRTKQLSSISEKVQESGIQTLLLTIKKQEKRDRSYLLRKKILPVAMGILILTIVFFLIRLPNILILCGSILVYAGLVSILVLFIRDYIKTSTDSYGVSIREFLLLKQELLEKWKRIPILYNTIYGFYIVGVLFFILGNTGIGDVFDKTKYVTIILPVLIIGSLILSGFIGEIRYHKRYKREHFPLLKDITQLLSELQEDE